MAHGGKPLAPASRLASASGHQSTPAGERNDAKETVVAPSSSRQAEILRRLRGSELGQPDDVTVTMSAYEARRASDTGAAKPMRLVLAEDEVLLREGGWPACCTGGIQGRG